MTNLIFCKICKMGHMKFFVKILFFGIPAGHAFWTSVGSIVRVDGISMQPTFNSNPLKNDWIYINKLNKYNVSPGDVVILISPQDPNEKVVKRVIAVNGVVKTRHPKLSMVFIPQGCIWVEGDNQKVSTDSNSYGPIPIGLVLGKVTWIVWPFSRFQALESKLTQCDNS